MMEQKVSTTLCITVDELTMTYSCGEQMLTDLNESCEKTGQRLILTKTMLLRNRLDCLFTLSETTILQTLRLRLSGAASQYNERLSLCVKRE
ncbi:hypothetical protein KIN20_037965 [Parelaphostrongylus tenuis]|uniref:Uncharacterized protein n=1 Tax=Parelaphostrongylus tenuis TaxID=148309 RepID=A0AAD5RE95_PARTN|nr:hypothetical protein KIN20_037965 [Parelaphostrongylus tenuis]